MSENRNRRTRDFSEYDVMSTEELKNILRLDSEAPAEQETDTELLLYIMGVLASRETNNTGKTALESWEDFQRNYLDEDEENIESTVEGIAPSKIHHHWMRRFVTVAAVLALIVSLAATASAIKWDALWNAVAHWANDTFSFVIEEQQETTGPSMQHELEYASLQEALKLNEQEYDFVPTWIPEGYLLEKVTVAKNPVQSVYLAQYNKEEQVIIITVRRYPDGDPEKIEIMDEPLEVYEADGIEYYFFANYDDLRVVWIRSPYECYISGDLTVEEMKTMIDSIGKG